ncbi:MAG: hypothetical protein K6G64_04085 [Eubacterium sp.]|nr:hypothetical protein [Eubacterium sp.]
MKDKKIHDAFDSIQEPMGLQEQIWEQLEHKNRIVRFHPRKIVKVAVVLMAVLLSTFAVVNFSNGGKTWAMVKQALGIGKETGKVATQLTMAPGSGNTEYTPDIQFIDETYFAFASEQGLVLIDQETKALAASIDLQKIGCVYFEMNDDEMQTVIYREKDRVVIFNVKDGKPVGTYYVYSIKQACLEQWEYEKTGTDLETKKDYYEKWKKQQEQNVDQVNRGLRKKSNISVSDFRKRWSTHYYRWNDGEKICYSFLVYDGGYGRYLLNTYSPENKKMEEEAIQLIPEGASVEKEDIPCFEYNAEDEVIRAVWQSDSLDLVKSKRQSERSYGRVWIPAYVIYGTVEKDGSLYAFGNFDSYAYYKIGNILEECDTDGCLARLQLKKTKTGYKVVDCQVPRDGAGWHEDVEKMTQDIPGAWERFQQDEYENGKLKEKARKELIQMYAEEHQLDIQYYKAYGWAPVNIKS